MALHHPLGIGDSDEQGDNIAVQQALEAAAHYESTGSRIHDRLIRLMMRAHTSRMLHRYERRWGLFTPNRSTVFGDTA